jgi:fructose-1,6-bisphosphatase/inositol monophosphatase family enzyme
MKQYYPNINDLRKLAQKAGEITRNNFKLGMKREWKGDDTPLTATDTAINDMVVETITREFPHVRVIGEEGCNEVEEAEYTVYCDPVDGTIPFCRGIPISAFSIAVVRENTPVCAVIYDPFQDRMWHADKGNGCYMNDDKQRVSVSSHSNIHRSMTCMIWWNGSPYNLHSVCEKLMEEGGGWTNPVSIAYFGGLLASGEIDATIFPGRKAWETAAMQVIAEEAGGKVTDIYGNPMKYGPKGEIEGHIISNGLIHDKLVEIITSCQ